MSGVEAFMLSFFDEQNCRKIKVENFDGSEQRNSPHSDDLSRMLEDDSDNGQMRMK